MAILKQNEAGIKVLDLCREHGVSSATFYKWRAKYGGMDAEECLKSQIRQEALEGSGKVIFTKGRGQKCG